MIDVYRSFTISVRTCEVKSSQNPFKVEYTISFF